MTFELDDFDKFDDDDEELDDAAIQDQINQVLKDEKQKKDLASGSSAAPTSRFGFFTKCVIR